jgi:two-component system, LytTR family, response regulator
MSDSMHLRALIIDDEELARTRLRNMLQDFEDELEVIDEAGNGKEAIKKIEALHPDIIFLDIQMPGCDGFEVVRRLNVKPFIVFVTAYDEYALKAFEENSVDYLLKPVGRKRLEMAVEKLRRLFNTHNPQLNENIERLLSRLTSAPLMRLQVKTGDKILLVNVDDIVYFEAKDKYTFLHTVDQEHIIDFTLADLEGRLDKTNFIRIHRSNIINLKYIRELVKWFGGKYKVRLKDKYQTELSVSRGYVDQVQKL